MLATIPLLFPPLAFNSLNPKPVATLTAPPALLKVAQSTISTPVVPDYTQNYQTTIVDPCTSQGGHIENYKCVIPPPPPPPPPPPLPPKGIYTDLGYQMALDRGWGAYWGVLDALITRESGWNNYAKNPYSTACGIGQDINGCEVGYDPVAQINWAYNYIAGRYGNPAVAWNHELATGWY